MVKLIIDIPKEKYDTIKMRYYTFPNEMKEWGLEAIRNGLPLTIKALEQQPCEDAISRIETIKYLNTNMAWYDEDGEIADSDEKLKAITDLINGVPSVTPKPKTGRWIHLASGDDCSECGWSTGKYISPSKYCPNCGAKMQEVEE